MRPIPYEVVDVFTNPRRARAGAVLMQRPSAEFGCSETACVFPPVDPRHTAQIRIFTPASEVSFAGHPNVGAAYGLARGPVVFGQAPGDAVWFEVRAGQVPVTTHRHARRAVTLGQNGGADAHFQ